MACGRRAGARLSGALLVRPSLSSGSDSARGRSRTGEQCAAHAGGGSSGYQNTQLFSQTLVLDSTGLELLGDELGPQDLAQEPAWVPKSC